MPEREKNGRWTPGKKGGPGRPKGGKNKFTALKDEFVKVYNNHGGEEALLKLMREDPKSFFLIFRDLFPRQAALQIDAVVRGADTPPRAKTFEEWLERSDRVPDYTTPLLVETTEGAAAPGD